jgi:hypothetical protein
MISAKVCASGVLPFVELLSDAGGSHYLVHLQVTFQGK